MEKRFFQSFFLQVIYTCICRWFLKIVVGVQFDDNKLLKQEKQFIILANHNSHLDTITLLASLPPKMLYKVKPIAARDYFGKTPFRAALSNYFINTLLIDRKGGRDSLHSIDKIIEALDEGYSLILFPEGTRNENQTMGKLKSGIAHILSARSSIKYIPTYLTGMRQSLPKGKFMVLPYKASVHFGTPTLVQDGTPHEIVALITQDFESMQAKYGPLVSDGEE